MSVLEELLGKSAPVAQLQPQNSWIQDLIKSRYQPQQGRVKRTPVGFNFTREPFDPSSYYKSLGLVKNISNAATATVQQEAVNREIAAREADEAKRRKSIDQALQGIDPNFTYSPGGGGVYPTQKGSRNYGLKGVSSNVANAANYFGSRYGIQNIGGWRSRGSVPGSDHPYGRALDFMTNDRKRGTALANDLIKNYKQWNVKYVIWNRYIWNPRVGWHKYNGPSPHTDHVHASFSR